MKRTTIRKTLKNRRHSDGTPSDAATDGLVLTDMCAVRDGPDVMPAQMDAKIGDEDAIDRLLANSGFDAHIPSGPDLMAATDDFEPDMATAFIVGPIDQDVHLQVQTPAATGMDGDAYPVGQTGHDDAPVKRGPLFGEDTGDDRPAATGFGRLPDEAVRNDGPGAAISPGFTDEALLFAGGFADDGTEMAASGRIVPNLGSVNEPPLADNLVHTVEALPVDTVSGQAPAVFLVDDEPENRPGSANEGAQDQMAVSAGPSLPEDGKHFRYCGYKTEQARINVITLILSVVASLASIVFYFLLMDMRDDLAKLNDMVDIMKEDIQMNREEPPAE